MSTQPRRRWPAGLRLLLSGTVALIIVAVGGSAVVRAMSRDAVTESPAAAPLTYPARLADLAAPAGSPGPGGDPDHSTLVLYDEGGETPQLGHQYAIQAANLASRGGTWRMRPIARYRAGDLTKHEAIIYIGVDGRRPPRAFLTDVLRNSRVPVMWMGAGVEHLFEHDRSAARRYGWSPGGDDDNDVTGVTYRGQTLKRHVEENDPLVKISVAKGRTARVLGVAHHADGSTNPWAVRSRGLTFIGEIPFAYAEPGDRYLAAADLILRMVDTDAPERHRALIRLEDVGPNTDPDDIIAVADFLAGRHVPFALAVYPYYRDPHGSANNGTPTAYRLVDKPEVVDALRYATSRGGVIIMHGYTHQFEDLENPYTGTSGADYEFFVAHVDSGNNVQLDGPVPPDSRSWVSHRLAVGRAEFLRVGLADPAIFEFPHYTGSAASYRAVHDMFGVRYDQGSYFDGLCPRGSCKDETRPAGEIFQQFFPYPVRDVYGSVVIPENLLNVSEAYNNNPARTARDIVAAAEATTVVRDGVASTFYHPYLGIETLAEVVDGIKNLGYTFVSPYQIIHE